MQLSSGLVGRRLGLSSLIIYRIVVWSDLIVLLDRLRQIRGTVSVQSTSNAKRL